MHGTIAFDRQGTPHTITLEDDGDWTITPPLPPAEDAAHRPHLDMVVAGYRGPSDGAFGPGQLGDAAAYLRLYYRVTSVRVEPREPMPPGTVY